MKKQTTTEKIGSGLKMVSVNRRARFEYEIEESYEAGLELVGTEVKSLRMGRVNMQDAFCRIENGEGWLYNMHVSPFEQGNRFNVEPRRKRKLLLRKSEIAELRINTDQKGLTIVPLRIYFLRGYAKIEIALARGKKLHDKRESIADRDRDREAQREMSER